MQKLVENEVSEGTQPILQWLESKELQAKNAEKFNETQKHV